MAVDAASALTTVSAATATNVARCCTQHDTRATDDDDDNVTSLCSRRRKNCYKHCDGRGRTHELRMRYRSNGCRRPRVHRRWATGHLNSDATATRVAMDSRRRLGWRAPRRRSRSHVCQSRPTDTAGKNSISSSRRQTPGSSSSSVLPQHLGAANESWINHERTRKMRCERRGLKPRNKHLLILALRPICHL